MKLELFVSLTVGSISVPLEEGEDILQVQHRVAQEHHLDLCDEEEPVPTWLEVTVVKPGGEIYYQEGQPVVAKIGV